MCVVERKAYTTADGRRETIETTRRCHRAIGSQLCGHVEHRGNEPARIIERRPDPDHYSSDKAYLVTERSDGRERVYRDVTGRSSKRRSNTLRRSNITGESSTMESPLSASSTSAYSSVEVKPSAPSPPPASPGFPVLERERRPRFGTSDPSRTVAPDGTAIYERPPLMEQPRATENERRTRFADGPPISSSVAEDDDPIRFQPPRRRPSVRVDTSARPSMSSSPSRSSPGLSQLPALPKYRPQNVRRESSRHQQAEDERQAQLERERLAESERRQQARRNAEMAAREASRERKERHRREAAAALEGSRKAAFREEQLEAELAQMARERAVADAYKRESDARKRESDQATRDAEDQLRTDADARARYYERHTSTSPRVSRRMTGGENSASPHSARSPAYGGVTLHQYQYPSSRRDSTISARGAEVIAREQARASMAERALRATRPLSEALGGISVEGEQEGDEDVDYELDGYYVSETLHRRESRTMRRDGERTQRRRDFFERDDRYS